MYYLPAKSGDDMSSGFCLRVLTHTYTRTYREDKRPAYSRVYVGVSN